MARARERYSGPVQLVVSDDGETPANCTLGETHIRRQRIADPAKSFRGNLVAGLQAVKHDRVLICEDDDHFHPSIIRCAALWLEGKVLVGEAAARYYNVYTRRYHIFKNDKHACLSGTAFRAEVIPWLVRTLRELRGFMLDMKLWKEGPVPEDKRLLWPQSESVVGIKGLPGRQGLGVGHRLDTKHPHDADGDVLRQWIGREDAQVYFDLMRKARGE